MTPLITEVTETLKIPVAKNGLIKKRFSFLKNMPETTFKSVNTSFIYILHPSLESRINRIEG